MLERLGMADEAFDAYKEALALDPESATAHYNLATHLARKKNTRMPRRHLRQVIRITAKCSSLRWARCGSLAARESG